MGFIEGITSGIYHWFDRTTKPQSPDYKNPADEQVTDTDKTSYTSRVVEGEPFRPTKCLFVNEMNDFYTDEELNTIYHTADEYRYSVRKYGLIYKSQKFENADTVEKLFEYAKDWIKNNYHGGITSFSITALDMHIAGADVDQYLVGDRVKVNYVDPDIQQETEGTYTVITAEYDLNNPDKNQYKIGIPDVTLNKVYGETDKSGGGGGGGDKDGTDEETDTKTEVQDLIDKNDSTDRKMTEVDWAMLGKKVRTGEGISIDDLQFPLQANDVSDFLYNLTADGGVFGSLKTTGLSVLKEVVSPYIRSTGGVDCETVSSNRVNTGKIKATDIKASGTAEIEGIKLKGVEFSVGTTGGKPRLTINGQNYILAVDE